MPKPKDIIREAAEDLETIFRSMGPGHWTYVALTNHASRLRTLPDGVWLDRETAHEMASDWEHLEGSGNSLSPGHAQAHAAAIRRQLDEEPQR